MTSELVETNASKEWVFRAVGMVISLTMLPMDARCRVCCFFVQALHCLELLL